MTDARIGSDKLPRKRRSAAELHLPVWATAPAPPVQVLPAAPQQRHLAPELLDGGCKLFRLGAVIKGGAGVRLRRQNQ